jgi:hypothetical protein
MGRLEGEIEDADYDDQAIKPGDTVYITAEDHYGATRVRLDIRRGEKKQARIEHLIRKPLQKVLHRPARSGGALYTVCIGD